MSRMQLAHSYSVSLPSISSILSDNTSSSFSSSRSGLGLSTGLSTDDEACLDGSSYSDDTDEQYSWSMHSVPDYNAKLSRRPLVQSLRRLSRACRYLWPRSSDPAAVWEYFVIVAFCVYLLIFLRAISGLGTVSHSLSSCSAILGESYVPTITQVMVANASACVDSIDSEGCLRYENEEQAVVAFPDASSGMSPGLTTSTSIPSQHAGLGDAQRQLSNDQIYLLVADTPVLSDAFYSETDHDDAQAQK